MAEASGDAARPSAYREYRWWFILNARALVTLDTKRHSSGIGVLGWKPQETLRGLSPGFQMR